MANPYPAFKIAPVEPPEPPEPVVIVAPAAPVVPDLALTGSLDSLKDVRAALAAVLRRIEDDSIDAKTGNTLITGLNTLNNMLIDARESKWTKRAAQLWAERERSQKDAQLQRFMAQQALASGEGAGEPGAPDQREDVPPVPQEPSEDVPPVPEKL